MEVAEQGSSTACKAHHAFGISGKGMARQIALVEIMRSEESHQTLGALNSSKLQAVAGGISLRCDGTGWSRSASPRCQSWLRCRWILPVAVERKAEIFEEIASGRRRRRSGCRRRPRSASPVNPIGRISLKSEIRQDMRIEIALKVGIYSRFLSRSISARRRASSVSAAFRASTSRAALSRASPEVRTRFPAESKISIFCPS